MAIINSFSVENKSALKVINCSPQQQKNTSSFTQLNKNVILPLLKSISQKSSPNNIQHQNTP